jgi:hypothetical protein
MSMEEDYLARTGGDRVAAAVAVTFHLLTEDPESDAPFSLDAAVMIAAEMFGIEDHEVLEGVQETMKDTMAMLREVAAEELIPSLAEPQNVPADHCYTVLQDHGPKDGGWGPAAVVLPFISDAPQPFIYTGDSPDVIRAMVALCRSLAQETGKPTRFVKFTQWEDVAFFGGSS